MMNLSDFTNLYSLSKTLRFKLIPQGNTLANLAANRILEEDQKRADECGEVKRYIDKYHKEYIERRLSSFSFPDITLQHFSACYWGKKIDELDEAQKSMMLSLSNWLRGVTGKNSKKGSDEYEQLYSADMVKKILPKFLSDEKEKTLVNDFSKFWTYFSDYSNTRKNMYSGDGKHTEIAFRIVKQNLPKFLDNIKVWQTIINAIPADIIEETDKEMSGILGMRGEEIFTVCSFNKFLSQSGIDKYNQYLGGYSNSDGSKIQGLNERVYHYTQQTKQKLPRLKPLFKQILSDRESISFIPEMFTSDTQMLDSVEKFRQTVFDSLEKLHTLLQKIDEYDPDLIFISGGKPLSELSQVLLNSWSLLSIGLERIYDSEHPLPPKGSTSKHEKEKAKYLDSSRSWTLSFIDRAAQAVTPDAKSYNIAEKIKNIESLLYQAITDTYVAVQHLLTSNYPSDKSFIKTPEDVRLIKNFLDSIKDYQHFVCLFAGNGNESDKDSVFYGIYEEHCDILSYTNHLYDSVRNYATQKPYSTDKIRMMFNHSSFLNGWDINKESDYLGTLLKKDGLYYVAILQDSKCLQHLQQPDNGEPFYEKMIYKQIPNAEKYFSSKQINPQNPPDDIKKILLRKKDKSITLTPTEVHRFIDYIQKDFIPNYDCLNDENGQPYFDFKFKQSTEYSSIDEFFSDIDSQGYSIQFCRVSASQIDALVKNGKIYLFQIYSKDFSPFSHGSPNLHTLYFKALFDESNTGHIKLNGGAQIYFRQASLKLSETTNHKAKQPIKCKNPLNKKEESVFQYDLIKDKRYTADHFELHIPITLNAASSGKAKNAANKILNPQVKSALAYSDNQYIIGIDRGERNLLYISVIDSHAHILEQFSMNVIEDRYMDTVKQTDYHDLLARKEDIRIDERKNWKTIEGIKETKEGYLSQAIHRICALVEKYQAIVVMEYLNPGFKNNRSAIEMSVYQKFEKMLCDKLSYMSNKNRPYFDCGGIMNAYQLAEPKTSYADMFGQNGIIFYVPAWLTSKIDPTTGFADMLHPRYETIDRSREFINKFTSITFNAEKHYFEFSVDYSAFPKTDADYKKEWVICTYGNRLQTFRDKNNNRRWNTETVCLTDEMIRMCEDYGIDYTFGDLRPAFVRQTERAFYTRFIDLLKLTLQMRNSRPGTDEDYLISPVMNATGRFYDSRESGNNDLPENADANGAYNIARKGLWIIEKLKKSTNPEKEKISAITSSQWIEYAQTHSCVSGQ